MTNDLCPTKIDVYGFSVAWIPPGSKAWALEGDDEFRNLPAHYMTLPEALDRVEFLKAKGFSARALALLRVATDTSAEFEANRITEE